MIVPFWKIQTTIRIWATPFHYITLWKFSSFNQISFFQYFYLGCRAPSKSVEEGGLVRLFFLLGCEAPGTLDWWVVFCTGCDSGLSGWYLMFCAGQYVVESWVNCLGRGDMQVRSDFGLRAERKPGCQSSFSRLRGRIQAHCAVLGTPAVPMKWCMHSSLCSCPVWCKAPYGHPHFNKLENVKTFRCCLHVPSLQRKKRKKWIPTNSILDEKEILKEFGFCRVRPKAKGLPHLRLLWVIPSIERPYRM
jgi:hypothetical protein